MNKKTQVILDHLERGTLCRNTWTGKLSDGRKTACLLAAIWPAAGKKWSSADCPASLMPQWLADLTPWIDDNPTDAAWEGFIRRYAALVPFFGRMSSEQSDALSRRFRASCVRKLMNYADGGAPFAACEAIAEALEAGREPTPEEVAAAEAADVEFAAFQSAAYLADAVIDYTTEDAADRLIELFLTIAEEMVAQRSRRTSRQTAPRGVRGKTGDIKWKCKK